MRLFLLEQAIKPFFEISSKANRNCPVRSKKTMHDLSGAKKAEAKPKRFREVCPQIHTLFSTISVATNKKRLATRILETPLLDARQ